MNKILVDAKGLLSLNNTRVNEGVNSLHTQLHPKDWNALSQFEGLVAYTVLVFNLGREKALSLMCENLGVSVSEKVKKKYVSKEKKRKRDKQFSKEKSHQTNSNSKKRKVEKKKTQYKMRK